METKNKVTVKINGQDYPIIGIESKEYLLKIGNFVDEQMDLVAKNNSKLSISMIAVLTCINIADQFFKLQKQLDAVTREQVDPLNKLEDVQERYNVLLKELEEKKEEFQLLQKQVEELVLSKENIEEENTQLKEKLQNRDEDLVNAENIINDLQNKLFENRIALVQVQKQLEEHNNKE
ncbi:putative cell division protein ZapA [Clostridium aceticum]|uniref:Cell division protein ZapA n=1 Tax=Clostridium aceticum TaxID=84022 RepID=A0A0G3W784_9CLOT|nr:cell division protein ZapA [Clostridium aceticum]AKL94511.1 putative cell division protein ZapA [Clostridium aceticum]